MRRRKGQPGRVIAIADRAQQRLCRRFRRLAEQHKPAPKIAVAVAREMSEDGHGLQGFAPCGRRLRRPWTPCPSSDENALTSASWRLPTIVRSPLRDRGLTTGHSISD